MEKQVALERPSKDQIALLPAFEQLLPNQVQIINSQTQAEYAFRDLNESGFIGFDTETKPTFQSGIKSSGPHLIQFATLTSAYLIQLDTSQQIDFVKDVLESLDIVKIGFGLKSDLGPLHRKLGIRINSTIEMSQIVRRLGYRQAIGVKAAVAVVLCQNLPKPKRTATSNWSLKHLSPKQVQYAANDAHAALAVFHALGCPTEPARPNHSLNRPHCGMPPFAPPFHSGSNGGTPQCAG